MRQLAANCFYNQLALFGSLLTRLDYALLDLEDSLRLGLQTAGLDAASGLHKQETRPTRAQVRDMVDSTHWLIKNVF